MGGLVEHGDASARFPTTMWSRIIQARDLESESSREALGILCARYWYPIYAFIRRKGVDAEQARDLTQEFFARLIEKNFLASADASKGRFRSFLLACVSHFLANRRDSERSQKRGGAYRVVHLPPEDGERICRDEASDSLTPEALFEYRWALAVLDRSLERLRLVYGGAEFERLKPFLAGVEPRGRLVEEAARMGVTEGSLRVAVHRLRSRYRKALRAEIAQTVGDCGDIEDEIRYLISVVAAAPRGARV